MLIPDIRNGVIEKALSNLFPKDWVTETAKKTGFIKREKKIDPFVFFWALTLGFGVHLQRSLAELRRTYQRVAGHMIVSSAFYDRFSPALVDFLKRCVERGMEHLALEPGMKKSEKLKGIQDLVAIDSSIVRLYDTLAHQWPGPRTNHSPAAAKINVLVSVFGATRSKVQIVEGKRGESKLLSIGKWVENRILLFDLGYFSFKHFEDIKRNGGFFVSRLKSNSNPLVLRSLKTHRGRTTSVENCRLAEIKELLKREVADFEVLLTTSQSKNSALLEESALPFRVVGIWNEEAKDYHFYVTNLPTEGFTAEDIAALYKARWAIELLFKELKSYYQLDSISSGKGPIVEVFLYTALLTLIVSKKILQTLRAALPQYAQRITPLRWAKVFVVVADVILHNQLIYEGINPRGYNPLFGIFAAEAIDPNSSRELLMKHWFHVALS